jgi:hypothetical protein
VLALDEVDMLLHPLKSELNWPIGKQKSPLDFTTATSARPGGLRWAVPFHMIDALFLAAPLDSTVAGAASDGGAVRAAYTAAPCAASLSVSARETLDDLARAIALGHRERVLQSNPHLVVLSAAFYHVSIKPLLARWMLEWFKAPSQSGLALPLVTVSFLLCTVTFTRILLTV